MIDGKAIEDYRFFKELIALPYVEAVYLTGSRARGDYDERSDLDLAICCPLATDEEWKQLVNIARFNDEILLRVDPVRLDRITDPKHRNVLLHQRRLLYLKTYGGELALEESKLRFFDVWHEKLMGWINYLPIVEGTPKDEEMQRVVEAFPACVDCIWVIARKCLAIHGMHTNTAITTFRECYMEGWLQDRLLWERMLEDYPRIKMPLGKEAFFDIYKRIPMYIAEMRRAADTILEIVKPYIRAHVVS